MTHRPEPTVRLSSAPPAPLDAACKAEAERLLAQFAAEGHGVDTVQVFAWNGNALAQWTAIAKRGGR